MVKSEFSKRNPFERNKERKVWGMIKEPEKLSIFIVVTMVNEKETFCCCWLF